MKLRRLICFIITLAVVMTTAMSVSVLSVSAEKVSTAAEYKESFDYAATDYQKTLLKLKDDGWYMADHKTLYTNVAAVAPYSSVQYKLARIATKDNNMCLQIVSAGEKNSTDNSLVPTYGYGKTFPGVEAGEAATGVWEINFDFKPALIKNGTQYSTQFAVVNREGMYTSETLLSAGINLEGTASGRLQLPDIHFIAGTDVTDCMKRAAEKIAAEMPFITDDREELVIIHRLPDWNLLYILNPTGHLLRIHYDLADMFGMETVFQYRFDWNDDDRIVSENSSCFSDTLAPHESALLFITEDPMTAKPSNLWGRDKSYC